MFTVPEDNEQGAEGSGRTFQRGLNALRFSGARNVMGWGVCGSPGAGSRWRASWRFLSPFCRRVLVEAAALAGLLGGALGLVFEPPRYPTVAFFALAVMALTYHMFSE